MDKHTPTPWEISEPILGNKYAVWTRNHSDFEGPRVVIPRKLSKEDAAFIVRAVNAHEDILNMLKSYVKATDGMSGFDYMAVQAKQAIAKAEGK